MSFLFFFKRKPHIVDCFTAHVSAYEFAKPKRGTAFFPDWWKALPKLESYTVQNFKHATNMRHCTGMIELFRNSFVLPMWCDASIVVGPQCSPGFAYQYADERSRMDEHPMYQYQGFISPTEYQHLKLESPWVFATKKSFNWAVVPPLYNSQHAGGYTALPGVVDLRYVRATNVQLILPRDPAVPKKVALNLNDPLLMYLPMTENGVEYRHHLVSQAEFAAMHPPALKFNGSGMALRRLRKAADAAQHCPFHNE